MKWAKYLDAGEDGTVSQPAKLDLSGEETAKVTFYEGILNKIVDFVRKVGVSYPGEIADSLMLKPEVVYVHTKVGVMQKKLMRLKLSETQIPHILQKRIKVFWSRGIKGYEAFKRLWLVTVPCEICGEFASTIRAVDKKGKEWNICGFCYDLYKI